MIYASFGPSDKYRYFGEPIDKMGTNGEKITLHRIQARRDIHTPKGLVRAGSLGGCVQKRDNLSQEGECWIEKDAIVYGKAKVTGDAYIGGTSRISGRAIISGNSIVVGNSFVSGDAVIADEAEITGWSRIHGQAVISEQAKVIDTTIEGKAQVSGRAIVERVIPKLTGCSKVGRSDHLRGRLKTQTYVTPRL